MTFNFCLKYLLINFINNEYKYYPLVLLTRKGATHHMEEKNKRRINDHRFGI